GRPFVQTSRTSRTGASIRWCARTTADQSRICRHAIVYMRQGREERSPSQVKRGRRYAESLSPIQKSSANNQRMTIKNNTRAPHVTAVTIALSVLGLVAAASGPRAGEGQPPAPTGQSAGRPAPPPYVSPDVQSDKRVTFRIFAPRAEEVRLVGTDIPRNAQGLAMTKGDNGVWELTIGPLDPGSSRYNHNAN